MQNNKLTNTKKTINNMPKEEIQIELTQKEMVDAAELMHSVTAVSSTPDNALANRAIIALVARYKGENVPTVTPAYDGNMVVIGFNGLRFTLSKTFTLMGSDNPQNRFKSNPSEKQVKDAFQYLEDNKPTK